MSSSSSDPAAALGDAWRHAHDAFRFSSVRGREVTATHLLRIGNYSTVDSLLVHGKRVESKPFRAGGHLWKLSYYPNGHEDSTSGRPTFMLSLMENRFVGQAADTTAKYDLSVLDGDGNSVYRCSTKPRLYSLRGTKAGFSGIWVDVMDDAATTAEEREKVLRHLKDDSLIVRCDVTVQSLEEESNVKWFLRRFLQ